MRTRILVFLILFAVPASAQQTAFQDPLLDRFVGHWILTGTIAKQQTTHDIDAAWVLAHNYLQFHETAREKDSLGAPAYEAIVYIGWDTTKAEYACLWLDVTGGDGLTNGILGRAKREKDRIAFLFKYGDGSSFHTTFVNDAKTDSWQWLMDNDENGTLRPFARVNLQRRQ